MNTPRFVGRAGFSRRFRADSGREGFTLTELAVVIATLGILAVLVLPSLAANRSNSQAFQCLANMKRLQLGSQLYADDNNDYFPGTLPNAYQGWYAGSGSVPAGVYPSWVAGTLGSNTTPPESGSGDSPNGCSTNDYFLGVHGNKVVGSTPDAGTLIGSIGGYVKVASAYKCPADKTIDSFYREPRYRDCSVNSYVGVNTSVSASFLNSSYKYFYKYSDFTPNLSPAQCFVFLDENPFSCNDGMLRYAPDASSILDVPAANHGNSGSFSFADGHAELHQWVDFFLTPNSGFNPSLQDPIWLASHGTCLK